MTILLPGINIKTKTNKKIVNEHVLNNEDNINYAYHAGLADGDGCFTKQNEYSLKMLYEEPIHQLHHLYLASVTLMTRDKRSWVNEYEPRKSINLTSIRLTHFIKKVAPFLIEKQNKALSILNKKGINDYSCNYKQHNKQEFLSYLAGFIDAEGSVEFRPNKSKYSVSWSNYNLEIIEFIKDNLKKYLDLDTKITILKHKKEVTFKNKTTADVDKKYFRKSKFTYITNISGQKSIPLLKQIVDLLTIPPKKENALKIINHTYNKKSS